MAKTYRTKLYDRLDRIVYDTYGSTENRLVEFVMESNPGLEMEGILLSPGLLITLPDRPQTADHVQVVKVIHLW